MRKCSSWWFWESIRIKLGCKMPGDGWSKRSEPSRPVCTFLKAPQRENLLWQRCGGCPSVFLRTLRNLLLSSILPGLLLLPSALLHCSLLHHQHSAWVPASVLWFQLLSCHQNPEHEVCRMCQLDMFTLNAASLEFTLTLKQMGKVRLREKKW